MPLLTSLLILIVCARLLGQLFIKFDQPALAGEILAGVLLGPSVLRLIQPNESLSGISELAVFLVILSAGLEMNFGDIIKVLRGKGAAGALLSFFLPLLSGILVGVLFQMDVIRTVFLGLCISITALPVTVRILQSFKLLGSQIAKNSVGFAIVNDLLALLSLGVILNLPEQNASFPDVAKSILLTGGKLVILAAVILGLNWLLRRVQKSGVNIKRIPERLVSTFGNEALFGIVVVFVLIFGSFSEMLGFHFVIGAFFGALLIDKEFFLASRYSELEKTLNSVTGGFLAPVFFARLGLEFNIGAIDSVFFVVIVLLVSMISKIFAGWLSGRIIGFTHHDSVSMGIILNGRGIMELVVAGIAFEHGFIGQGLFSTLVLMGLFTTMATPILFKRWTMYGA